MAQLTAAGDYTLPSRYVPPRPTDSEWVCFNPLRVAAAKANALPASPRFPDGATGCPTMYRWTFGPTWQPTVGLTEPEADRLFRTDDDLVFSRPDDRTLQPVQNFNGGRRQAQGRVSWMVFLSPVSGSRRVAYFAIFHRRDLTEEYAAEVTTIYDAGIAGGGVKVACTEEQAETIREGSWVLLAAENSTVRHFGWYRVTDRGQWESGAVGLHLHGQDWPYRIGDPESPPQRKTWVVWVPGTVAVLER